MLSTTPSFPVFLCQGKPSEELLKVLQKKGIIHIDQLSLTESASDKAFNESKYMGTRARHLANGIPFLVSNALELITKKGGLSLNFHFSKKVPSVPYEFILIGDFDKDPEPKSNEEKLLSNVPKRLTIKELFDFDMSEVSKIAFDTSLVKVTCGFLTKHKQKGLDITGHITQSFGISLEEAAELEENRSIHFGKTYESSIINLTINGEKDGGSIIMVPDIGETSHITNNTIIRSVLSGPVLEKYNAGIFEFNLKDIDEKAKQEITIKLEKTEDTEVSIIGWYIYVV